MADAVSAATTGHMRVSTASGPTASAALLPEGCAAPTAADPFEFELLLAEVGADTADLVKDGETAGAVAPTVCADDAEG